MSASDGCRKLRLEAQPDAMLDGMSKGLLNTTNMPRKAYVTLAPSGEPVAFRVRVKKDGPFTAVKSMKSLAKLAFTEKLRLQPMLRKDLANFGESPLSAQQWLDLFAVMAKSYLKHRKEFIPAPFEIDAPWFRFVCDIGGSGVELTVSESFRLIHDKH